MVFPMLLTVYDVICAIYIKKSVQATNMDAAQGSRKSVPYLRSWFLFV
jgi:hypothetical protein